MKLNRKLPILVMVFLLGGLLTGVLFPHSRAARALYLSGTYFPKVIVTFATVIIFAILSGATSNLVLVHRERAGHLFGVIVLAYVGLGAASLAYVTLWIPFLTSLPLAAAGGVAMSASEWFRDIRLSFSTLVSDQPLIHALVSAVVIGYVSAVIPQLRAIARGLIACGQMVLSLFKRLLWYYPLMIGCLAIGIPLKFGFQGMTAYGRTTFWVGLVTVSWSAILATVVTLTTSRTFKQVASYYAAVWPTGFGTGGSYEALAVNVVSAETELGLPREIAEVSVVFGTVMNKSCATISVLLVTISVMRLLNLPISLTEILILIPPVLILGLESPGIPGGAAFFMSPIVASLLRVGDADLFVATFITMYSGLIPMFSTAGNTTNDGLVGALLNDRFASQMALGSVGLSDAPVSATDFTGRPRLTIRNTVGAMLMTLGVWMLVSPQSVMGLEQLKWMHSYAFQGEVVIGGLAIATALYLFNSNVNQRLSKVCA